MKRPLDSPVHRHAKGDGARGTGERQAAGPKRLTSNSDRADARRTRDAHWRFMDRVAKTGTVWWCIWNKEGRPELPDEYRCCLISGMELNEWMHRHPDWWEIGEWDPGRYARPLRLTDAGREALAHRYLYDMEDVTGGLVEPGFIVTPLPASIQSRVNPEPNASGAQGYPTEGCS